MSCTYVCVCTYVRNEYHPPTSLALTHPPYSLLLPQHFDELHLMWHEEQQGLPTSPAPCCPAYTMDIILRLTWWRVLYIQGEAGRGKGRDLQEERVNATKDTVSSLKHQCTTKWQIHTQKHTL